MGDERSENPYEAWRKRVNGGRGFERIQPVATDDGYDPPECYQRARVGALSELTTIREATARALDHLAEMERHRPVTSLADPEDTFAAEETYGVCYREALAELVKLRPIAANALAHLARAEQHHVPADEHAEKGF